MPDAFPLFKPIMFRSFWLVVVLAMPEIEGAEGGLQDLFAHPAAPKAQPIRVFNVMKAYYGGESLLAKLILTRWKIIILVESLWADSR